MPSQVLSSVENNFTKGLLTEYTGLNFPENAATSVDNCVFTLVGDVIRREGFDYEANATIQAINSVNQAVSTYKWNNASGDGLTQFVVQQVGATLYFYRSSQASINNPLSTQLLTSTITLSNFTATGGIFDPTIECQYADGNGYLFVFQPTMDPIYVSYSGGAVTGNVITVQIRDFVGLNDGLGVTTRPTTLSTEHNYNLANQGWTSGAAWTETSATFATPTTNPIVFSVSSTSGVTGGDTVNIYCTDPSAHFYIPPGTVAMTGVVAGFVVNTSITVDISSFYGGFFSAHGFASWQLVQTNLGHVNTWFSAVSNYPSDADVWWYFKDNTGIFNPTATVGSVSLGSTQAPQGHFILNAFNQNRSLVSSIANINPITTSIRPRTGCWFQGRVWYTGVDAQQPASGDTGYYSWTESIYFSQIVQTQADFGACYQQNDPTSETLFDLLPTDGGVVQIQGCGPIYKLFPLMNALLIFAANGVWYLSGSQGIGFAANDFSIVKLSAVRSISSYSFVDINGLPMFWNEEGIYTVEPAKQGQGLLNSPLHVNPLEVNPITVGTIQTFFDEIPLKSKQYARGVYDPINYIVQWIYKSANETSVTDRYNYDSILNFNNHNKAFYPYSFDLVTNNPPAINSIVYVQSPGGTGAPNSIIKYSVGTFVDTGMTFAEENNTGYLDWVTAGASNNFVSSFTTGFKLHGQAQRRFQIPYVYVYSRMIQPNLAYTIQSVWDYAAVPDSNRWSLPQYANIYNTKFNMVQKRHRLRGQGLALQLQVNSVQGLPFDIMGWSAYEMQNMGV